MYIFDEEIVARHANKMALLDMHSGVQYTFGELQVETRRMANYFHVDSTLPTSN